METRPELIMLQRTMVVVEGVARTLDPSFNMWRTAEPVVGQWIARNLGPAGVLEDAREGLDAARHLIRVLPEMAQRAELLSSELQDMAVNGMKLDAETTEAIGRAEARSNRPGHVALWVIAALGAYWLFMA